MPRHAGAPPVADTRTATAALLHPNAVAVVGASEDTRDLGGRMLLSLVKGGYRGPVYPVADPEGTGRVVPSQIMAKRVLKSAEELPEGVDLAVVAMTGPRAVATAAECVRRGVRAVLVPTTGFAEAHQRGRELQMRLVDEVGLKGARLLGPNSTGLYCRSASLDLAPSIGDASNGAGKVALLSQAGDIDHLFIDTITEQGLGLALYAGLGNSADLGPEHLLATAAEEPGVTATAVAIVGNFDRLALSSAIRNVGSRVPVLVTHKVRGHAAHRAARAHSGGASPARESMPDLIAAGATMAVDIVDLADRTAAAAMQPRARGCRVAVLSTSSGAAVAAATHLEEARLELPVLPEQVQRVLLQWLPEHGTAANPVYLGGALPDASLRPVVEGVLGQAAVDGAVLMVVSAEQPALATALSEVVSRRGKPVVAMVVKATRTAEALRAEGIPVYPTPLRAARAFQALVPGPL